MPALRATIGVRSVREIQALLEGLTLANVAQLRKGAPLFWRAPHVRYRREPAGQERWQTVRDLVGRGYGDCEDLAAWLAASLRVAGHDATARVVIREVAPGLLHALTLARGKLLDPSKMRGMKGRA